MKFIHVSYWIWSHSFNFSYKITKILPQDLKCFFWGDSDFLDFGTWSYDVPEFLNAAAFRPCKLLKLWVYCILFQRWVPLFFSVLQYIWSTCDNLCTGKIVIDLLKMSRWTIQVERERRTVLGLKYVPFLKFVDFSSKAYIYERESIAINVLQKFTL